MEFQPITESDKVGPGEYLLHKPSSRIVMCGAFKRGEGKIKVLSNGKLMEDKIENFQKIKLTRKERHERKTRGCAGCKKCAIKTFIQADLFMTVGSTLKILEWGFIISLAYSRRWGNS